MTDPLPEHRGVYYDEHRRGLSQTRLNEVEIYGLEEHQPDDGALWAAVGIVLVALAIVLAVLVSV